MTSEERLRDTDTTTDATLSPTRQFEQITEPIVDAIRDRTIAAGQQDQDAYDRAQAHLDGLYARRDALNLDTVSPASVQHYVDRGDYLPKSVPRLVVHAVTQEQRDEERYRMSVELGIYNDWRWED
jgi:hypothetical protein